MPKSNRSITIIVAATVNDGIGAKGGMPWRLPAEMKYFARVTTGEPNTAISDMNTVIMGRKTWESIPSKFRPLKGRRNLIISRTPEAIDVSNFSNTSTHSSIETALATLSTDSPSSHRTFLIGGSQLYNQSLSLNSSSSNEPVIDRLLLTRILHPTFPECDVFFPSPSDHSSNLDFKSRPWKQSSLEELRQWVGWDVEGGEVEEKGVRYRFEMWVR